jgi:3-keto-L-gulonate-6-phosphate decarboxylase
MIFFNDRRKKAAAKSAAPVKKAAKPAEEWMAKKPVNTPETRHQEAMYKWKSDKNKAQNKHFSSDTQIKGIEQSMSKRKKFKAKGSTVTAEGGRAIDTGRM